MSSSRRAAAASVGRVGPAAQGLEGEVCGAEVGPPSLLRQSGWNAAGSACAALGSFLVGITTARMLGPDGAGRVAYLLWFSETASILGGFGLAPTASRYVAHLRGQRLLSPSALLARWLYVRQLASTALAAGLVYIVGVTYCRTVATAGAWLCLSGCLFVQSAASFYISYLAGEQRFDLAARVSAVSSLLLLVTTIPATAILGLAGPLLGQLAAGLPGAALGARAFLAPAPQAALEAELRARCLRFAFFTWIAAIVSAFVWSRLEVFFLERYWTPASVAMFTTGLTLSSLVTRGPLLFVGALLPHFAYGSWAEKETGIHRTYASATRFLAFVVFPCSLGLAAVTPTLLPAMFGDAFRPAVFPAMVLTASSVVGVSSVGSALVYGLERSHFVAFGGAVGAILSLAACLLVIPRWGTLGAACSRSAIQVAMVALGAWYIRNRLGCPFPMRALVRLLLSALVAASCAFCIGWAVKGVAGLVLAVAVGMAVYLVAVRFFHALEVEDEQTLLRLGLMLPPRAARLLEWTLRWTGILR